MFRLSAIGGRGVGVGLVTLEDEVVATMVPSVLVVCVIIPQMMLTCTGDSVGRSGVPRCLQGHVAREEIQMDGCT